MSFLLCIVLWSVVFLIKVKSQRPQSQSDSNGTCIKPTDFRCENGECLPSYLVCHYEPHCIPNGEDELHCPRYLFIFLWILCHLFIFFHPRRLHDSVFFAWCFFRSIIVFLSCSHIHRERERETYSAHMYVCVCVCHVDIYVSMWSGWLSVSCRLKKYTKMYTATVRLWLHIRLWRKRRWNLLQRFFCFIFLYISFFLLIFCRLTWHSGATETQHCWPTESVEFHMHICLLNCVLCPSCVSVYTHSHTHTHICSILSTVIF